MNENYFKRFVNEIDAEKKSRDREPSRKRFSGPDQTLRSNTE